MANKPETQNLPAQADPQVALPVVDDSDFANLLDTARFNHLWRVATVFSQSQLVPEHFVGKPANCFVALQMALRLGIDPMMFMQKSYVIAGKPSVEAQLVIALINARGPFTGPIQWRFEGEGDKRQCTAYATHKATGKVCEVTLTKQTVKDEGWLSKPGSKWKTMEDQMFRYRTATWLGNVYCPEVKFGLPTVDELMDSNVVETRRQPDGGYAAVEQDDPETINALLDQLAAACPASAPEPPDMEFLAEFVTLGSIGQKITRSAYLEAALASSDAFYGAFLPWASKQRAAKVEVLDAEGPEHSKQGKLV